MNEIDDLDITTNISHQIDMLKKAWHYLMNWEGIL